MSRSCVGNIVRSGAAALAAALLAGCAGEHVQSVLHPASRPAAKINALWWFMFGVTAVVFVVVIALMLIAVFRRPGEGCAVPPLGSTRFIVGGGIVIPAFILTALLYYSLDTTVALRLPPSDLTIQVIGHRWWWEVRYPQQNVVTANELHIPVGEPVRLELWSADVNHSFWVPNLNGKMDVLPDHVNHFWLQSDRAGTFRGQCAEYCGLQHARMAFVVVALPQPEFEEWLAARQRPHPEPDAPLRQRGRQVFFEAGCDTCHAVRGAGAEGQVGPDLTHIGSRVTLGAGTVPNNPGNLAGWISNSQEIKPGNKMPRTYIGADDLHALREYLESLR
jgi:cytochrome c oxidase subunit II